MLNIKTVDLAQTKSASTIIFNALHNAIISGEIEDGMPLRQQEIGRMFNTSRIPVREAIYKLEQLGMVKIQHHKGATVAAISTSDVDELHELRTLVECAMIKKAVPKMTDEVIAQAQSYCDQLTRELDSNEWGHINRLFHSTLCAAADLPIHLNTVNSLLDRVERYVRANLAMSGGMKQARIEHEAILQACIRRDADEATELTAKHIRSAKTSLINFLNEKRSTKIGSE